MQLCSGAVDVTAEHLGACSNPSWLTLPFQMEPWKLFVSLQRVSWCLGWQVPAGTSLLEHHPITSALDLVGVSLGRGETSQTPAGEQTILKTCCFFLHFF